MVSHIDLTSYQYLFANEGRVVIPNILEERLANEVTDFLDKEMLESWWTASLHPASNLGRDIPRVADNLPFITFYRGQLQERMGRGEFCYSFDRASESHYDNCHCKLCVIFKLIRSEEMKEIFRGVSGISVKTPKVIFASRYQAGDFLSYHTDQGNGELAFVLNLTRNWKPWYGGNLVFLTPDLTSIKYTITPKFNSLTIFRVPPGGVPHYVEQVAAGVKEKRLAITGWYLS